MRDGHRDREVAFRLSEYALQELSAEEGFAPSPELNERILVAWARYEIERELRAQGRVNPILVGATSDLYLYPDLLDVLRAAAAADPPVPLEEPAAPAHAAAHPEPIPAH